MRIYVKSESEQPLGAQVRCIYKNGKKENYQPTIVGNLPNKPHEQSTYIDIFPKYEIDFLLVWPNGGYWRSVLTNPSDQDTCYCKRISNRDKVWWLNALGIRRPIEAKNIKVGVIDINNAALKVNSDVTYFQHWQHSQPGNNGHGSRVCRILTNQQDNGLVNEGICNQIDLSFYDTTPPLSKILDNEKYVSSAIYDGILYLSNDLGVDIICIAGGIYDKRGFDALHRAVKIAQNLGTLVVAAVGNDASLPCAAPACFSEVVGVGGLGLKTAYPNNSYAALVADRQITERYLTINDNSDWFVSPHCQNDENVDILAPSIGVTLTFANDYITDIEGTSYSCPMIVGLLASLLSEDGVFSNLKGLERSKYARKAIERIKYGVLYNST